MRIAIEQGLCRHQHARRAVAALRCEVFHERSLQRVQIWSVLDAVAACPPSAFHALGQRQAREMRLAVDRDRARAASSLAAAEFRGHVADEVAQGGKQIDASIDEDGDVAAVMAKLQGGLGHEFPLSL